MTVTMEHDAAEHEDTAAATEPVSASDMLAMMDDLLLLDEDFLATDDALLAQLDTSAPLTFAPSNAQAQSLLLELLDDVRQTDAMQREMSGGSDKIIANTSAAGNTSTDDDAAGDDTEGEEDEPESHDDVDDKEVELLEKELIYLTAQTEFLTAKRRVVASSEVQQKPHQSKRAATSKDRARNLESELDHNLLQQLVSLHQFSIDNMRAMLSFAPVNDVRIALMTPLESYIHLGSDFVDRRNTILQMHDEKVDTVRRYLNVQSYRFKDSFERFGKTYRLEFFQMKFDNVTVQEVLHALHMVHQAVDGINRSMNALTIREVFDSDAKKYKHQRMVSNLQLSKESPVVEANMLIFLDTNQDGSAVITGDYIDRDDLYPYDSSNRIRMDHTCGWMFEPHIDSNGVPCVVLKNFVLTKYHMHQARMSSDAKDLVPSKMEAILKERIEAFIEKVNETKRLVSSPPIAVEEQHVINV